MRVFARRQRVLQQTTQHAAISKPAPLARAEVRHKSSDAIILQLQRTIGNRAAQRLLLQRKIDFSSGEPTLLDPIPLVLGGTTNLGRTRPGMNGTVFPDGLTIKAYKEAVFNALQPQTYSFKQETKDERTGKVDASAYALSVFADVSAITKPNEKKKWSGGYPASILRGAPPVCAGKGPKDSVNVELDGKPDGEALCSKVQTHEREHVADLKKLMNSELKPYHDFLLTLTGKGKTDQDCVVDLFKQVGSKDALAAGSFVDKWLAAVQVYDKPGGTHHSKFTTSLDQACTTFNIKET
jgi:hypothetical protein